MLEKFLAVLERIADALEVIAASPVLGNPGLDAPRTPTPTKTETEKPQTAAQKKAAAAAAEKAAAAKAPTADDLDPLGGGSADPMGDDAKKEYTLKEVRDILSKVIDKDGRASAFEVLAKQGHGAKAFTELKPEYYEDVYVECEQRLA